jgi:NADH-quinone oxidoreductase subunit E/NADP-reducing hydrogenase subunit HndA
MANIKLSAEKLDELKAVCKSFNNDKGELINVLHKAQGIFGYLPAEVQEVIAKELNISVAHVYGVVSFYSFFTMLPKGEHPVSICLGTACYVRGAEKVIDEFKRLLNINVGETTPDGKFSLACLRCVGACGLAPVVLVGEKVYGRVAPEGVKDIVAEYATRRYSCKGSMPGSCIEITEEGLPSDNPSQPHSLNKN